MRPRVALVAFSVGERFAVPRILANYVRQLHREIDFVVVSEQLDVDLRPVVDWRPVRMRGPARARSLEFFARAPLELYRARADLVHTALALVPAYADVTSVQWSFAAFRRAGFPAPRAATALERWCYTRRTGVLAAASLGAQRELESLFHRVPVVLTPNGVDRERFRPDPAARRELRGELGVGEDDVVALTVANYARPVIEARRKGIHETVEGFRRANGVARLWILGAGDPAQYRAPGVEFLRPRADTAPVYAAADLFLLPSRYENFSLATLEAAAAGLPLVVTPVSGAEDLLAAGAGVAVEPDAESIAAALTRVAADRDLRAELGTQARAATSPYTLERSAAAVLGLYRSLLRA